MDRLGPEDVVSSRNWSKGKARAALVGGYWIAGWFGVQLILVISFARYWPRDGFLILLLFWAFLMEVVGWTLVWLGHKRLIQIADEQAAAYCET